MASAAYYQVFLSNGNSVKVDDLPGTASVASDGRLEFTEERDSVDHIIAVFAPGAWLYFQWFAAVPDPEVLSPNPSETPAPPIEVPAPPAPAPEAPTDTPAPEATP